MSHPLLKYLLDFYDENEFPALLNQAKEWKESTPFAGLKILDGTCLFRNTLSKHLALLCGGADLTVTYGRGIPYDPSLPLLAESFGIKVVGPETNLGTFDAVLDCGGVCKSVSSRLGYVELTRSGLYHYQNAEQPVFSADNGRIKEIETGIGTGDGFRRALTALGYPEMIGRKIVVFGCGKVGFGVIFRAVEEGAEVYVVDDLSRVPLPPGVIGVDRFDLKAVENALEGAWAVVSATGIKEALRGMFNPQRLIESSTLIINMGVEDEWGSEIPDERVLCHKKAINFVLEEPTRLRYIDPTMALHNAGVLALTTGTLSKGLNIPSPECEEHILASVYRAGLITDEIKRFRQARKVI